MKKLARRILTGAGILVLAACMTRWWLTHSDQFPVIPESVAEYLVHLWGAMNQEEVADLEIVVGFVIFTPVAALIVVAAGYVWKRIRGVSKA